MTIDYDYDSWYKDMIGGDTMTELVQMHKVFVYGSLKSGFGNHRLLRESNSEFLGTTYTKETNFLMFSFGAFPAVVKNQEFGYGAIEGELYSVDTVTLFKLDMLEGNGTFYTREKVELDDGNTAWMYLIDQPSYHMSDEDEQIEMGYYDDKMVFIWRLAPLNKTIERWSFKDEPDVIEAEFEDDEDPIDFDADKEWEEFHRKYGHGRYE